MAAVEISDRMLGMFVITEITGGTADALSNDPAKVALAMFVNGVRMSKTDPETALWLSNAAEYMVTGHGPTSDDLHVDAISAARKARESLAK